MLRKTLSTYVRSIRLFHQTRLDLDQLLERLDGEAHRRGRLNVGLVRGAMRKATIDSTKLNSTQALLLIRCTGSLLISELPRQRQQVLNDLMKIFKEKSVEFDVTHYNSFMRVSLQNQFDFDPLKLVEEMKTSRIQPNLTSFRLLTECSARYGRFDEIEQLLNEMKLSKFNIDSTTLTNLLASYARHGDVERVESLSKLFDELNLEILSETFEQKLVAKIRRGEISEAKTFFRENSSKMSNESFFRLLIEVARCNDVEFFRQIRRSIDENSLADLCVEFVVFSSELFELKLDEFALILIDSFPKRDETLRFDLIHLSMLNLMKIRLPSNHFRPFSTSTADEDLFQSERQIVTNEQIENFRRNFLDRFENFAERKDRWLIAHQLLFHAFQNSIPLSYIFVLLENFRRENFDFRPHFLRPIFVKFRRIFKENPNEMRKQTEIFFEFLQRNFSIDFDDETIDLLIEFLFDDCRLTPMEIDSFMKKVQIRFNAFWPNLFVSTLKKVNSNFLNSLKVFLNTNKTIRFELTTNIREEILPAFQSLINQINSDRQQTTIEQKFHSIKDLIDFIEIMNKRFVKNSNEFVSINDCLLINIFQMFYVKDRPETIDLLRNVFNLFEQRTKTIRLTNETKENISRQLGHKSVENLLKSLKNQQEKCTNLTTIDTESTEIFVKTNRNSRTMSLRELEDHLIELKRKKMNTSGIISKLLIKYSTECLDGERTMTKPVRDAYQKRINELESIYFDKNQTTGFPSLGVIAILIDYYSRIDLNLDKVVHFINLSNEIDPNFKLDPHKCVSVIRLLIRKDSFNKAIELIESLGRYENVPNYMYRRVRDLLIDAFKLLKFDQFNELVQNLLKNNYVDPSSTVLSLIVRKSSEDLGPLHAFETLKAILVQWNNLVGMFPIIRKLLRDDCSEELKQILIKIGKIRSRTFAYEQLALALIHERRPHEAVRVCQNLSRSTFEEHCQRYVRELFFFPQQNEESNEFDDVYDSRTISLVYFLDYFEQFPSNTRHLSIDTLFFHLLKSYEKINRLDELTKLMRDQSSKYLRHISSKTKDAFSQAGITLPIKSLTSPKLLTRSSTKTERFLDEKDYEDDEEILMIGRRMSGIPFNSIISFLKSFAPLHLADQSWDNVGLLVEPNSTNSNVERVFFTNDLTEPVLDEAIEKQVQLIISYHPPIFTGLKRLTQNNWKERIVLKCVQNGIAVYSPHTSWDAVTPGINDWLVSAFGKDGEDFTSNPIEQVKMNETPSKNKHLLNITLPKGSSMDTIENLSDVSIVNRIDCETTNGSAVQLSISCSSSAVSSIVDLYRNDEKIFKTIQMFDVAKPFEFHQGAGRLIELKTTRTIGNVVENVKNLLGLKYVRLALANGTNVDSTVKTIAVCAGSGANVFAKLKRVDVELTGELSHHAVLDAIHRGTSVILCDHTNTERGFLRLIKKRFDENFGVDQLTTFVSERDRDPLEIV